METNCRADKSNVKNEEEFLSSVESTLNSVENSIHKFIQDVPRALADSGLEFRFQDNRNIEEVESKTDQLIRLFPKPLPMNQKNGEVEREKILALELELQHQMKENERAQEEIEHLKDQILSQSTYCASLGAVLGNLTWRACKLPQVVDVWLSGFQHKVGEFLSIADGSFVAFINTYQNAFPPTNNVEYQFIIALLGIVTNISASPEGREFLITNPSGRDFVQKIIKYMPVLPLTQGALSLKKLMFMILYNVSMNNTGLEQLFESRVGNILNYYLEINSLPDEIQLLCLRILQSITYELTNPTYIRDLIECVPIGKLQEIATSKSSNTSAIAKQVLRHLRNSQKYLSLS